LERILSLGEEYRPLLRRIEMRFLSDAGLAKLAQHFACPTEWVWRGIPDRPIPPPRPSPFGWSSVIASDFPEFFAEFREKRFSLLWRGSSDGFGADEFHSRCDKHANTLTLILDKDGNIFGGFTPVEWDSKSGGKTDSSAKSFLFTLKNPHSFPAGRFALKYQRKDMAISCDSRVGPYFHDIRVFDNCNRATGNCTGFFDWTYNNDTGLVGKTFFTGSVNFQVKEIEVFEIS
jgi:hypothetical protein